MKINSLTYSDIHPFDLLAFLRELKSNASENLRVLCKRMILCKWHQVGEIECKYFQSETCTCSKIFTVSFCFIFMKISASYCKLVIIPVFNSI